MGMNAVYSWQRDAKSGMAGRTSKTETAEEALEYTVSNCTNAEVLLARAQSKKRKAKLLQAGLRKISEDDRQALIGMFEREAPLPRTTPLEVKIANAIAQREKRAKVRLTKANAALRTMQR